MALVTHLERGAGSLNLSVETPSFFTCISGNIDVLPTVDAYVKEYCKSDMRDYADIVSDAITNEFGVMKYIGSDEDDYVNAIEESAIIEGTKVV